MYEIYAYLESVTDPRQAIKVKHKLSDILLLVLLGTLVEADTFVEIEEFGKVFEDSLKGYLSLENGIPSHDTIQRVMSPSVTAELQLKWSSLKASGETEKLKKIINIDGKTMRGNRSESQRANHVVSAYSKTDSICLGQLTVDEKSNE
ncbi:ISAs1 family transposase, partial [Pseudolactococcus yaeyamensis]